MPQKRRSAADAAAVIESLGLAGQQPGQGQDGEQPASAIIYFDGDSVEVAPDYLEMVHRSAERFKASQAGLLVVAGHAVGVDEPEHEVELSHLRTRAVASLLEKQGVLSHQIICVSRGANEPLVDPSDSARSWINRRVEIREGALVPRPPAWAQQRRKKKPGTASDEPTSAPTQSDSQAKSAKTSATGSRKGRGSRSASA
ncbi:MAG: OmpA family protein [Quisquiliibacterium sp.]